MVAIPLITDGTIDPPTWPRASDRRDFASGRGTRKNASRNGPEDRHVRHVPAATMEKNAIESAVSPYTSLGRSPEN